ncbi:MAG: DoxX family protein [Bryobacterales bacterium]|nr:DoxX family protein [Bryobacterales bacterium]MBV9401017.1 DoxX family protein [Bryobacterales bacterium]
MSAVDVPIRESSRKRWVVWVGRVLSVWPVFVVLTSATWKLTRSPFYVAEFTRIGWPESALTLLACLQLGCIVLYVIPQTAILGAILLTGYLGGAIASYTRMGEPFPVLVPLSTSVVAWLGIYLRDERLWTLVPLRRLRSRALVAAALVLLGTLFASPRLGAQWLKYPTAGVPRKANGAVNMSAPAPRMADGKPDLSGIWTTGEPARGTGLGRANDEVTPADPSGITASRQMANIGVDFPGGLPYQPWLVPIVSERTANLAKDDPHIKCLPDNFLRAYGLPHLLKFVQTPNLLVVLNEMNAGYRQVFTDARLLPQDPTPSWQGYSSGRWSGDTLFVETIGIRDDTWVDWNGSVLTTAAKVREQFRRPDFGHLEIQVTVDDPKAYTKPWTVTLKERIVVDTELVDEICLENEQSLKHMK